MKKKVIIDCDTGVDDAQAILLALLTADVEVVAITCVVGNVSVEQAARNTVRVLHAVDEGCCNVPVYLGCEKPLLDFPLLDTIHTDATKYHGHDGLGDAPHATTTEPPYDEVIQTEKAAVALCRLVKEHPGEITLVCLGPLTNLALALRLDGTIASMFKEIFVMGGAVYCKGNVTVVGEFNTATDPEAASIVLENAACPTYLMSWETSSQVGLDWEWHTSWINRDHKVMRFIKEVTAHTVKMDQKVWATLFCAPDLVTMAWALDRKLSIKEQVHHCYVDCGANPLTRGQLIVDWRGLLKRHENITVCLEWNPDIFKTLLNNMVQ